MSVVKKLHLWVTRAQRTDLAPELLEQMGKIKDLCNYARLLIERIRRVAQPNKAHRTIDPQRMVPQDEKSNERLQLMTAFQEGIEGCIGDNQTAVTFFKIAVDAEKEMNRIQDRFLRQAQIYSVNELKKFVEVTYVEIRQSFDELSRRRTAYDFARDRLRFCAPNEVEQRGHEAMAQQKEFERQAFHLFGLLERIPEYQIIIAKAVSNFIKAEAEYGRVTYATLKSVEDPEKYGPGSPYARMKPGPSIIEFSRTVAPIMPSSKSPSTKSPATKSPTSDAKSPVSTSPGANTTPSSKKSPKAPPKK